MNGASAAVDNGYPEESPGCGSWGRAVNRWPVRAKSEVGVSAVKVAPPPEFEGGLPVARVGVQATEVIESAMKRCRAVVACIMSIRTIGNAEGSLRCERFRSSIVFFEPKELATVRGLPD